MNIAAVSVRLFPRGLGQRKVSFPSRKKGATHSRRVIAEALERRQLLSTVTWDGGPAGTGFDWNIATNWSTDTVPTASDDVVISSASLGFVSIAAATDVNVAR